MALVAVLIAISVRLMFAPVFRSNTEAGCLSEYARARTLAETTAVDFMPFPDVKTHVDRRCGVLRTAPDNFLEGPAELRNQRPPMPIREL